MGLMDKFKNLFTDEEIIEDDEDTNVEKVEIKEVKKEPEQPKLPTFMREKIEKEEKNNKEEDFDIERDIKIESIIDDEENSFAKDEEKNNFKFPIDLEEDDFIETRSRQSIHNKKIKELDQEEIPAEPQKIEIRKPKLETKVADLYKDKKDAKKEEDDKRFRATPIISPIYGVLDKNYTSDDVEERKGNNLEGRRHSKSVDFDSVRKKAYGSLADDIKENLMCENCEYLKEVKECKKKKQKPKKEDEYLYDILDDETSEQYAEDDITMDEAAENYFDYGVEYKKKKIKEPITDEDVKIVNHAEEEEKQNKEIPPVKSSINLLSTLKKSMGEEEKTEKKEENLELTDDLFNLIDSMYDERDD